MRTIIFGTKNERSYLSSLSSEVDETVFLVGMHFGILIVWIAISCITLPLIQWFMRWRDERAEDLKVARKALDV